MTNTFLSLSQNARMEDGRRKIHAAVKKEKNCEDQKKWHPTHFHRRVFFLCSHKAKFLLQNHHIMWIKVCCSLFCEGLSPNILCGELFLAKSNFFFVSLISLKKKNCNKRLLLAMEPSASTSFRATIPFSQHCCSCCLDQHAPLFCSWKVIQSSVSHETNKHVDYFKPAFSHWRSLCSQVKSRSICSKDAEGPWVFDRFCE